MCIRQMTVSDQQPACNEIALPFGLCWNCIRALVACVIVVALAFGIVRYSLNSLLRYQAEQTATNWAKYLAHSLPDIEETINSGVISKKGVEALQNVGRAGNIFRYKFFTMDGRLSLTVNGDGSVVEHLGGLLQDDESYLKKVFKITTSGLPESKMSRAEAGSGQPSIFAETYAPVIADGKVIGVVEVYVDVSDLEATYTSFAYWVGLPISLLLAASLLFPFSLFVRESANRRLDERTRYLASHDALTGLLNRTALMSRLAEAVGTSRQRDQDYVVYYFDLDGFKDINDRFQHAAGDQVLVEVGRRLSRLVGETEGYAARLGGDEFVVLKELGGSPDEVDSFAEHCQEVVAAPIDFEGHELFVRASVGYVTTCENGVDSDELLKRADLAMYRAKSEPGSRRRRYSHEFSEALRQHKQLARDVRDAINSNNVNVHYQPVFCFESGLLRVCSVEALARIRDAGGLEIPPSVFVPICEELGLISRLGLAVLHKSTTFVGSLPADIKLSFNIAPAQLLYQSVAEDVGTVLQETGFPANRLICEITEEGLAYDSEHAWRQIDELRAMGVKIALDDFGMGHSSLKMLMTSKFDHLKLDRSITTMIVENTSMKRVIADVVRLSKSLGAEVTGEGIETVEHLAQLRACGCGWMQGYLLSPPVPADEILPLLLRRTIDLAEMGEMNRKCGLVDVHALQIPKARVG